MQYVLSYDFMSSNFSFGSTKFKNIIGAIKNEKTVNKIFRNYPFTNCYKRAYSLPFLSVRWKNGFTNYGEEDKKRSGGGPSRNPFVGYGKQATQEH
jgi:hypothetical protein